MQMIDASVPSLSISRQCELLGVCRSMVYYESRADQTYNLELKKEIDRQYRETPFYGSRKMTAHLCSLGYPVNRKRVARLMREGRACAASDHRAIRTT